MGVAILTESVRDVYRKQTNEYNFKINNNEYRVRVAEDSNGCEELWWNDDNSAVVLIRKSRYRCHIVSVEKGK